MELSEENISEMLQNIPTFSQSVMRILELTSDVDCSAKDLVSQIVHDPILTAKVLKLVNSAYFGLSRKVDSIQQSVVYVGVNTIKSLAISVAAMGALPQTNTAGLSMGNYWSHSLMSAVLAKLLAQKMCVPRTEVSGYFIAGLLHDIGKIIFSHAQPDLYREVLIEAAEMEKPLHMIEQQAFGVDHAALGAMLAAKWQLPGNMVEAIRQHHKLEDDAEENSLNFSVFTANQVTKILEEGTVISKMDDVPGSVLSWLGMPLDEVAESLPNLEKELESASVFVQLSA